MFTACDPVRIVHREPAVALGLEAMLARVAHPARVDVVDDPFRFEQAASGRGLLVVDLESAGRLQAQQHSCDRTEFKLIVVSIPQTREAYQAALEMDADGLLTCGFTADEFVEAVETVRTGAIYRCPRDELLVCEPIDNHLTMREVEVARYLTGGHAYKEIADVLGISVSTVKTHVKSIFSKLRVNNRVQASCLMAERGLTPVRRTPRPGWVPTRGRSLPSPMAPINLRQAAARRPDELRVAGLM